jgi:hypothetical protein
MRFLCEVKSHRGSTGFQAILTLRKSRASPCGPARQGSQIKSYIAKLKCQSPADGEASAERPRRILVKRKKENKEKGRQPIHCHLARKERPQVSSRKSPFFLIFLFPSNESLAQRFGQELGKLLLSRNSQQDEMNGHRMGLTKHGKMMMASAQFEKGCAFVGAAHLMRPYAVHEPQQYVVLHLVCQGIELIIKGLLLIKDFDGYRQREKKFGHNIDHLVKEAIKVFKLNPLNPKLAAEIKYLAERYSTHQLRYASVVDIFIAPSSIGCDLVIRKLNAVIRLSRRQFSLV